MRVILPEHPIPIVILLHSCSSICRVYQRQRVRKNLQTQTYPILETEGVSSKHPSMFSSYTHYFSISLWFKHDSHQTWWFFFVFCHDLWTCWPKITQDPATSHDHSPTEVRTRTMPAAVNLKAQVPVGKDSGSSRPPNLGPKMWFFFSPKNRLNSESEKWRVDSWNPEKDLKLEKPSCFF